MIEVYEDELFNEDEQFDEAYAQSPQMMTVRNQLMNKLGADFSAVGGSMNPKILIQYKQNPKIDFEITPNGKNLDIVGRIDKVPDTVHKKRGIAYMRAGNIIYDYIMDFIEDNEERVEENMKLEIRESARGEYFVGVYGKDQANKEYDRTYVETRTFRDRQDAWEFALKWNLRGYYIDFASNEMAGYGNDDDYFEDEEYDEYSYAPYEMKKTFNSVHEAYEDSENFSYLDDPFSELKKVLNDYFNEFHDPVHTKVYYKNLNYGDIWAMDMKVSAYDGVSEKTYSLEFRDAYDGILYVRPQNGSWEKFYDFKSFIDWLDEDIEGLF